MVISVMRTKLGRTEHTCGGGSSNFKCGVMKGLPEKVTLEQRHNGGWQQALQLSGRKYQIEGGADAL